MRTKKEYHYFVETSQAKYGYQQTNTLDVPRVLQHKPYWRTYSNLLLTQKKVLVLNDYAVKDWTALEMYEVPKQLNALQKEGFRVYYLSVNGRFYTIDEEVTNYRPFASGIDKQVAAAAAKELGLSIDEIFILNHQHVQDLMEDTDELWADLPSYKDIDLSETVVSIPSLVRLFAYAGTKIKSLNLTKCMNLERGSFPDDLSLPTLETLIMGDDNLYRYRKTSLSPEMLKRLVKAAPNLKTFHMDNKQPLDLEQLFVHPEKIEALRISQMSTSALSRFLALPGLALKDLGFIGTNDPKDPSPTPFNLPVLEKLSIQANSKLMAECLQHPEQLKELRLTRCNTEYISTNKITFGALEHFSLKSCNLPAESILLILQNNPKLKVVDLDERISQDVLFEYYWDLQNLEELSAQKAQFLNVNKLFKNKPKLKHLRLEQTDFLDLPLDSDIHLDSLDSLELVHSKIGLNLFNQICAVTPNLKKLIFQDTRFSINEGIFQCPSKLFFVEELSLSFSHSVIKQGERIESQTLSDFLALFPNLKILSLSNCTNLLAKDFSKDPRNPRLEQIECTDSIIHSDLLSQIIASTTLCKTLLLSRSQIIGQATELWPQSHSFETLKVDYVTFEDPRIFYTLFANSDQIKTLSCSGLSFSGKEYAFLDERFYSFEFEALETFNCFGTFVSATAHIFSHSPHLKSLSLNEGRESFEEQNFIDLIKTVKASPVENLYISRANFSYLGFRELLLKMPYLRCIDCEVCSVTGDAPGDLPLPFLEIFNMRSNAHLYYNFVKKIVDSAPSDLIKSKTMEMVLERRLQPREWNMQGGQAGNAQKPISQQKANKNMDANTRHDPSKTFDVTKIFYALGEHTDPAPNNYRLCVFDTLVVNPVPCIAEEAFTLKQESEDLALEACHLRKSETDLYPKDRKGYTNQYYGKTSLRLSEQWQSLPSLSSHEKMSAYHLREQAEVEFAYSKRDNLYYIRQKPDSLLWYPDLSIDFILTVPDTKEELPLDIALKINELLAFKEKSLIMKVDSPTGFDYLQALNDQKTGACRHRSLVFKDWMLKTHPEIKTRIVENECHSFVEIFYNNQWLSLNLGGYPAKVRLHEENKEATLPSFELNTAGDVVLPTTRAPKKPRTKSYFPIETAKTQSIENPLLYMEHLLSEEGQKKLIHTELGPNFRHHLQAYCKKTGRPCFYIHKPEDLVCSESIIKREGNRGVVQKGQGGPLHDFLMKHQNDQSKPVLIVNYDNFNPADIVRFNQLIDEERQADGSPLPLDASVIGLMNLESPNVYNEADFRSRFDTIIANPLNEAVLQIPPLTDKTLSSTEEVARINLYNSPDWENALLGHWVLKGQNLEFVEGSLLEALKKNKTSLSLNNAPWSDPAFKAFWEQALLFGGFDVQGVHYALPKHFTLHQAEGYAFQTNLIQIKTEPNLPKDIKVLNAGTLSKFFGNYRVKKDKSIQHSEGILQQYQGQTLSLYLSDYLDSHFWAAFLDKCEAYNIQIDLYTAPGVSLPEPMNLELPKQEPISPLPWPPEEFPKTAYIESSDIDVTLAQIKEEAITIDVSEVLAENLLVKVNGHYDEETGLFAFAREEGALLRALQENKTVILKGQISKELANSLTEFLIKRANEDKPQGRLLIVSNEALLFPILPQWKHRPTLEEKQALLIEPLTKDLFAAFSLSQLQAIEDANKRHPGVKPWEGLESLPPTPKAKKFNPEEAKEHASLVNVERVNAVENILKEAPFAFLAGKTGVGKTTFIKEIWQKKGPLYSGKAKLKAWAEDKNPGQKTLFIDEANLGSEHWSLFEGLYNKPPGILIDNVYTELGPEHKVIFAGNPLSYGGERQLPSFFARHGNTVVFDPLPPAYLFEEILRPIFEEAKIDGTKASAIILEVADYMAAIDNQKVLISPRELGMMALLTASYCKKNQDAAPEKVAAFYAYQLAKPFVPESALKDFESQFQTETSLQRPKLNLKEDFLITETNQLAFDRLNDFLDLSELRQSKELTPGSGLGGLILEGEPGLGKTELVVNTLLARGYQKQSLYQETHPGAKVFYHIPISISTKEREKFLQKAFEEGAIVLMDEINSAPMMEEFLNDLLMRKDATNPGFMVIGTQNPATMHGRGQTSQALAHRLHKINLEPYSKEEMQKILIHRGLPLKITQDMVDEYLELRSQLQGLCFRDLLKRAKQEIKALAKTKALPTALFSLESAIQAFRDNYADDQELLTDVQTLTARLDNNGEKLSFVKFVLEQPILKKQSSAFFTLFQTKDPFAGTREALLSLEESCLEQLKHSP